jgi:hypothetical protein
MTYLTCIKHRSYQRKHIDVCRRCPDNDACEAFKAFAVAQPPEPPPPSEPGKTDIPIPGFLQELRDIRELVADAPMLQETGAVPPQKKPLQGIALVDFIRSALEGIRKLC